MTDKQTTPDEQPDLNQRFLAWLKEHNAQPVALLRSPNGGVLPIQDGLAEHFRTWPIQIAIEPRRNGD